MPRRTRRYSLPQSAVIERRPLWPALPPPSLHAQLGGREVELVVEDDDVRQRDLVEAHRPRRRRGRSRS